MAATVLVLGGYGNFGARIAARLVEDPAIQVIVAGRSAEKCRAFAAKHATAPNPVQWRTMDVTTGLAAALAELKPQTVIHTCGPYQGQDYSAAKACINAGCHYIDLADGRGFVDGIGVLDAAAKAKGVTVISGASSVPCFSAAVIDHYAPSFKSITSVDYAISTAQRTHAGMATTTAVLGYTGKAFKTMIDGRMQDVYGFQDIHSHSFPLLGRRFLGNCDIPDLSLFPLRYPDLQTLRFYAGTELMPLHAGLWLLSWLVRARVIKNLAPYAGILSWMLARFDIFGSDRGGFYMTLKGTGADGAAKEETFHIIAKSGQGPFIPSIPPIILARMLARGELKQQGAMPCVGLVTLAQYLGELQALDGGQGNIVIPGWNNAG
jgi:saccharopine dehydrogenase-like NADP-dependent oxidoreductase